MPDKGIPIVIAGPSGAGKGTVSSALVRRDERLNLSVSMTTRLPRPGEEDGVQYFFVDEDRFKEAIFANELAEWAQVYGNFYGTPKQFLNDTFQKGIDVVLDIDVQGAASVRCAFRQALLVYLLPPSFQVLQERLFSRDKGEGDDLERRIEEAKREIQFIDIFDYVVINDSLDDTVAHVHSIIQSNRQRQDRRQLDWKDWLEKSNG